MRCTRTSIPTRWMVAIAICVLQAPAGVGASQTPGASRVARPAARANPGTSCEDMLPPPRLVKNTKGTRDFKVGPTACFLVERNETVAGRKFIRLQVGLDGKADGYVSTNPKGDYRGYMTNAPDLVFPQTADSGPVVLAIVDYLMANGAMMSVLYPDDKAAWNGKVYVTVHGATTRGETLVPVLYDK